MNNSDHTLLDIARFNEEVVGAYNRGTAEEELPADLATARSIIPAATAKLRDFSYIAPEIPVFDAEQCVGCMLCVAVCPDTAILGKVVPASLMDNETIPEASCSFAKTTKYYDNPQKKGIEPGLFTIAVDPSKCKGCGECVEVCGDHEALKMVTKSRDDLKTYKTIFRAFQKLPETPKAYIQDKAFADMMLADDALLYVGGAGSCMGCGEATAIRMMLAATGFTHGAENVGIVAATGCNSVFASTYPYNPYRIPWMNSLFENAPAVAMGVRARWDQLGWSDKRLWVLGGDGAMYDIGFQSLSRMLASGMDIKVLVLDTQVYSNTGGQSSTASYYGQDTKLSAFGKETKGKTERRKELAQIVMMHPNVYVAQTTTARAHIPHFFKAVIAANEHPGPAVIIAYTACQPEHGVGDEMASEQAKRATDSRAFPIFVYDPKKGQSIRERLSLQGNPNLKEDWAKNSKTEETFDFVAFARTEGRFAKHFDKSGNPDDVLLQAQEDRLQNWRILQELAGLR